MSKIIVAIDSFKGCLTSAEANQAAAEGIRQRMPDAEVIQIPVSDGGEGWLEAFQATIGGELVDVNVRDPLMRPLVAQYLIKDNTAVIEIRVTGYAPDRWRVKRVMLNGNELKDWRVSHADLVKGGVMEFEMDSLDNP